MAVDEWLLEAADWPVLRVYQWLGDWGSVGYFGALDEAKAAIPGVRWVRRWTGGGTVDHRADWTYTVAAPKDEGLAKLRGAESYRVLHAALAECLLTEGLPARLSTGQEETGAALCFENPVSHDLVGIAGRKLAGAGQRRTSRGLLHQGSVAGACHGPASKVRAERLACCMAAEWEAHEFQPPADEIAEKARVRYASKAWTERR
jgi:lipoate-protein ligase A